MPMKKTKNAAALAAAGLAAAAHAQVSTDPNAELETVLITSQRAERISRGATGLDLDQVNSVALQSLQSFRHAFGTDLIFSIGGHSGHCIA